MICEAKLEDQSWIHFGLFAELHPSAISGSKILQLPATIAEQKASV